MIYTLVQSSTVYCIQTRNKKRNIFQRFKSNSDFETDNFEDYDKTQPESYRKLLTLSLTFFRLLTQALLNSDLKH